MHPPSIYDAYEDWVQRHGSLTDEDRQLIKAGLINLRDPPLLSVAMPLVPELRQEDLRCAIDALRNQLYPGWELWLWGIAPPAVLPYLQQAMTADTRIRWSAQADAQAVTALACGEMLALLEPGAVLAEHTFYEVAVSLRTRPAPDVLYADEDRLSPDGHRHTPRFKPLWSPELLATHDMLGQPCFYRMSLLQRLGGPRPEYGPAMGWDLALRATAATTPDRIVHLPTVLCHGRDGAEPDRQDGYPENGERALRDWLAAEGLGEARLRPAPLQPSAWQIIYPLPVELPPVSVIIPTRDRPELLRACCTGLLQMTDWPADRLEVLVVDNGSTDPEALALLRQLAADPRLRVLSAPGSFNYPRLNNLAAGQARGSLLVLLNNDIEVLEPGWLREMAALALQREVGMVGAKLLYPTGEGVQHAGLVFGPQAVRHLLRFAPANDPGYGGQLALTQALSAVTGACMVLRREVYEEVGGLDEGLAVGFNDIDLCLRIQDAGYRIVWTPHAVLVHRESASRGLDITEPQRQRAEGELRFMQRRWGEMLEQDPYHNPNLMLYDDTGHNQAQLSVPRRTPPWRRAVEAVQA
ncbi:glycosyltransferase family 2 protein [Roseomonas sp. ACRSG]|nr:glycosyltransferase family 2 protein [Roseomonas sp. ACRSG]